MNIPKYSSQGVTAGGGGRGQTVPPSHFSPGNHYWPTGERETSKKGKWRRKEGKLRKGRWKIENGWGGGLLNEEMRRGPFFFFFHFSTLFWVYYQNGNFLPGKSISRLEKIRKNDFVPSENYNFTPLRGGLEHSPLEHWDGTADSEV